MQHNNRAMWMYAQFLPAVAHYFLCLAKEEDNKRNLFQKIFTPSRVQKMSENFPNHNILENLDIAKKFIENGMGVNSVNPYMQIPPLGMLFLGLQNTTNIFPPNQIEEIKDAIIFFVNRGAHIRRALASVSIPYTRALNNAIRAGNVDEVIKLINNGTQKCIPSYKIIEAILFEQKKPSFFNRFWHLVTGKSHLKTESYNTPYKNISPAAPSFETTPMIGFREQNQWEVTTTESECSCFVRLRRHF